MRQHSRTGGKWPARTALVVAHPGHELRVWRWLELNRPIVVVVTDGSGRSAAPRISGTEKLIRDSGARPSECFGVMRDRDLYANVLRGKAEPFRRLVDRLTREFVTGRIECIVGDAAEGQVMAHDLLREVRREAARRAEQRLGWPIRQFEFALDLPPDACPRSLAARVHQIRLDKASLDRKLAVARGNAAVAEIVALAIERYGESAFAVESLFPCTEASLVSREPDGRLAYEIYGEQQVRLGNYREVIRYADHVYPIVTALGGVPLRAAA